MQSQFTVGAVVYGKYLAQLSQFYTHVVGLPVVRRDPDFVVLQSPAFQLVIAAMPPEIADQITLATPPIRRESTSIKLCFAVASISAAREAAATYGGKIDEAEQEWEFQGSRVCDGHDPEGNIIQIRALMP